MCCADGNIDQHSCKCIMPQVIVNDEYEDEEEVMDGHDSKKSVTFLMYGLSLGAEAILLLLIFILVYVFVLRKPKSSEGREYEPVKMMN